MTHWICRTCGTQYAASEVAPAGCSLCEDDRGPFTYTGPSWTTLETLQDSGTYHSVFQEYEPNLIGIGVEPPLGIMQRALLLQTPEGNILWDCNTFLDEQTIADVKRLGGIQYIAISHPHYYSSMVEWANAFDATILLHEADKQYVMRPDKRITFWSGETYPLLEGVELIRLGGHFPGGTVLHWQHTSDQKGALLTGDIIAVIPSSPQLFGPINREKTYRSRVTFLYSHTYLLPLPASEIRRIRTAIAPYRYQRLYSAWFSREIFFHADQVVLDSADRYLRVLEEFPAVEAAGSL